MINLFPYIGIYLCEKWGDLGPLVDFKTDRDGDITFIHSYRIGHFAQERDMWKKSREAFTQQWETPV